MESAFEEAGVTGYEGLVGAMTNDAKDRDVLAAAVRCGAHAIITHNVRHFRPEAMQPFDLDILTPDEFLVHRFHLHEEQPREKLTAQAEARGVDRGIVGAAGGGRGEVRGVVALKRQSHEGSGV